jgi:hypothetical protein
MEFPFTVQWSIHRGKVAGHSTAKFGATLLLTVVGEGTGAAAKMPPRR